MIEGSNFWSDHLTEQLIACNYKGKKVYTYKGMPDNLYMDLVCAEARYHDNTAIVTHTGRSVTYSRFLEEVNRTASYLSHVHKIKKGDMIALILYNTIEFCTLLYAASRIGAAVIPVSSKCHVNEWRSLLTGLPVKVIFLDERLQEFEKQLYNVSPGTEVVITKERFTEYHDRADLEEETYPRSGWEDEAVLMFTSGTTTKRKAVILSNFNILNAIFSYESVLGITQKDKTIIATPIYHIIGVVSLLGLMLHCGGTVYLHLRFDPQKVLECIFKEKITFLHSTPTVFKMLLDHADKYPELPALRMALCGSANTPPSIIEKINVWLPDMSFRPVYGLTESTSVGAVSTGYTDADDKKGASGIPVPGIRMKTIREDGTETEAGEAGELLIFGSVVSDGYYGSDKKSLEKEGWLYTGDIARLTPEGCLYIIDRKKDMIIRGGEKIWSNEVENVLYEMEGIVIAALIGIPDEKYGEAAVAVVKSSRQMTEEEIKRWVSQRLAKYKVPARVVFVDQMPRTESGKINKKVLREQYDYLV